MNLRIIPFPSHRSRHTRRLPIVILRRRNLGHGAFTVTEDQYEEYAMSLLVSSFRGSFEPFREQKSDPVLLFKPQISREDFTRYSYSDSAVQTYAHNGFSQRSCRHRESKRND